MNEPLYQEVDQALAELSRSRDALATLVQTTRDRTVTATSRRRVLAVTVGLRGELRNIVFKGESYRTLPPRELAQLIIDTVEEARSKSLAQASAVIGGVQLSDERLKVAETALQRNLEQFQIVRDFVVPDSVEPAPIFIPARYTV